MDNIKFLDAFCASIAPCVELIAPVSPSLLERIQEILEHLTECEFDPEDRIVLILSSENAACFFPTAERLCYWEGKVTIDYTVRTYVAVESILNFYREYQNSNYIIIVFSYVDGVNVIDDGELLEIVSPKLLLTFVEELAQSDRKNRICQSDSLFSESNGKFATNWHKALYETYVKTLLNINWL